MTMLLEDYCHTFYLIYFFIFFMRESKMVSPIKLFFLSS